MNNLNKKLSVIIPTALAVVATPLVTLAQGGAPLSNISIIVTQLQLLVNGLLPLVAAIALLAFFWGLAKYVFQADDDEAKAKGKNIMIGGIVALFLIAAIGGIIEFISNAFGIDTNTGFNPTNIDNTPNTTP